MHSSVCNNSEDQERFEQWFSETHKKLDRCGSAACSHQRYHSMGFPLRRASELVPLLLGHSGFLLHHRRNPTLPTTGASVKHLRLALGSNSVYFLRMKTHLTQFATVHPFRAFSQGRNRVQADACRRRLAMGPPHCTDSRIPLPRWLGGERQC